jgi:hypothetical protein
MHGHMGVKDQWHISSEIWSSQSGDFEDSYLKTLNIWIYFLKKRNFHLCFLNCIDYKTEITHLFFVAALSLYCGTG